VVLVTLENVECTEHKLVLIVDQLLQQVDVVCIFEVVPSQAVHVVDQFLLALRQRRLRPFYVHVQLLGKPRQFKRKLLFVDHEAQVGVDHSENVDIFFQNEGFKDARSLLIQ
jgi:hypothetical protein